MKLQLFENSTDTAPKSVMSMHEHNGVWVATLPSTWTGDYYLLDETVYTTANRTITENIVTDPYSADLAVNG